MTMICWHEHTVLPHRSAKMGENKISEEIELLEHGIERLPGGYYNALAGQLATSYIRQAEVTGNSSYQEKALQTYQKMEDNGNTTLEVRLNIAIFAVSATGFHRCHGDASSIKDRLS